MVSKGVDYYAYIQDIGLSGDVSVAFTGPKVGSTLTAVDNFQRQNLQIDSANIQGWDNYTGPFTWDASLGDSSLGTETNEINSLTGDLESGSTMTDMMSSAPVFGQGVVLSYGFYDSGDGSSGLTNQDQSYVYCSPDMSNWMGDIAERYPQVGNQAFSTFVLAGAHDSGMNTMDTVNEILGSAEAGALEAAITLVLPVVGAAIALGDTAQVIMNASMTQKDSVADMLNLGCRYFDFRPGTMYPGIVGYKGRYHQHLVIPGRPYVSFLVDLLTWLDANPSEIVIVSCNTQGFASDDMKPSPQDLVDDWAIALTQSQVSSVNSGDATSLDQTYAELIAGGTRVIFLNQIADETTKYDSYDGKAYATLTPAPIVAALAGMTTSGQEHDTYTVLQLQGTCTGIISKDGFVSESWTASPLMSTKAFFDCSTLPWVAAHGSVNLTADKLVVLLNDFIDNATAYTAITWTLQRMGIEDSVVR